MKHPKKFEVKKVTRKKGPIRAVMYRIADKRIQEVLTKAVEDSGKSATNLVNEMVIHCLIEAGYLEKDQ